jgi:hypothetical protein
MYGEFRSAMGANGGLAFVLCVRPLVSTLQTSVFAFRVALGYMLKKMRVCPLLLLVGFFWGGFVSPPPPLASEIYFLVSSFFLLSLV